VKLKRIKIFGFKSFADKVNLEFHEGITGVVGPNGCGKSNISDSFRWVLGEVSAKSLRGNKMEDVIFAGTHTRKPLNYAEVSITLTDIGGLLPTEFEELEITRRYHRSGESEFLINRQAVRMKDVQSLLLDSGIGKNAFSIFEQGKIDQVIQFTPLERRHIFEEAAGILRFLQRKREAMKKLEQTDQNISRVKDIHKEVEKQITVSAKQAEEARIYKEKKVLLQDLDKGLFVAKWHAFDEKIGKIQGRSEEQENQIANANENIANIERDLKKAKDHVEEGELELRAKSEEVYKARSEKQIKNRERQTHEERLKESSENQRRWQIELENIIQRREARKKEMKVAKEKISKLEEEISVIEKTLKGQKEKVVALEEEVTTLREEQQQGHEERLQLLQTENHAESELKQNNLRLENNEGRERLVKERQQQLEKITSQCKENVEAKRKEVASLSKLIDEQKEILDTLEEQQKALSDEIASSQAKYEEVQRDYAESGARYRALKRLHDEMEGFSTGSKRLLQEASNAKSALHGKLKGLYEYITPKQGAEMALSVVLKPYAQTLVVEKQKDFDEILSFAAKNKLQDFSLLCLENLQQTDSSHPKKNGQEIESFLEKVSGGKLAEHFLKEVFFVKDKETAFSLVKNSPGCEAWVENGAYLNRHNVIFYTSQGENNVFVREAEIKALEQKLTKLDTTKSQLDKLIGELQEKRAVIQNERIKVDKESRRNEMTLVESNFILQRFQGDFDRANQESTELEQERAALQKATKLLQESIKELTIRHQEAKSAVEKIHRNAASLIERLEERSSVLKKDQEKLIEMQHHFHQTSDEFKHTLHSLHVMEVQEKDSEEQVVRLKEEIETTRDLQEQFKEKSSEYEKLLSDVDSTLKEVVDACSQLEENLLKRKEKIKGLEEKLNHENERLKKLEGEEHKLEVQVAQIDSSKQALAGEFHEKYQMTLEEAFKEFVPLEKPIDQVEKEVRGLRRELETVQSEINMTSIEEHDKHKTRFEFLNKQIDDMAESKKELIEIITKLDEQSRVLFNETFQKVRENFLKNFRILFNGGEADLKFIEGGDVLEAGIEIIAKPPGKQMRSIFLCRPYEDVKNGRRIR
jgi:chromosome segregation protein